MFRLFATLSLIFLSLTSAGNAETPLEKMIREKRMEADKQRAITLQQIQHRQANPQAFMAKRVAPAEKSISFKAERDGHFYVPAKIDGRTLRFMADTGATSIFISQSDARKVGIRVGNLNYNVKYQTANGAIGKAAIAKVKKIQVGPIIITDVPITVSKEKSHIALLGMEFFNRMSKYAVENGELTIHK